MKLTQVVANKGLGIFGEVAKFLNLTIAKNKL